MQRGMVGRYAVVFLAGASLAACATARPEYSSREPRHHGGKVPSTPGHKTGAPYQVGGIWYVPRAQPNYNETGVASWYGDAFHMKPTADGEIFDKDAVSAAHTTLPLPSLVEVTNLDNGRRLTVRVNDRGPFVDGRIIDLSHEAARRLGYDRQGLAHVRVRYLGPAPLYGEDTRRYAAYATPPTPAVAAPPTPKGLAIEITQAPLAPLPTAAIAEAAPAASPLAVVSTPRDEVAANAFRVQAGAFSTPQNAERAVARLAAAGSARVEPVIRNGTTLYRVVLDGAADEDSAELLRQKVAGIGFVDARVIRPF